MECRLCETGTYERLACERVRFVREQGVCVCVCEKVLHGDGERQIV